MPVELGEGRKSSGGSFSRLSFGDIMRGTELAPFSRMCVCVCASLGVVGAMGRDAVAESNQHLWLKL